jgi:hypothetical protein
LQHRFPAAVFSGQTDAVAVEDAPDDEPAAASLCEPDNSPHQLHSSENQSGKAVSFAMQGHTAVTTAFGYSKSHEVYAAAAAAAAAASSAQSSVGSSHDIESLLALEETRLTLGAFPVSINNRKGVTRFSGLTVEDRRVCLFNIRFKIPPPPPPPPQQHQQPLSAPSC